VTYASETWVLKENIIQKLLIFERKILRRIFGLTKENQIWRVKTNEELDKLIKHKNITNYTKAQRLSWFGHVQRMKIFNCKPLTKRSQRRTKYRWEDNINLLQPTGYVMHQQFNIQQLYALPTMYLCVLYLSENKQ
jgi:hypothetical protein